MTYMLTNPEKLLTLLKPEQLQVNTHVSRSGFLNMLATGVSKSVVQLQ